MVSDQAICFNQMTYKMDRKIAEFFKETQFKVDQVGEHQL